MLTLAPGAHLIVLRVGLARHIRYTVSAAPNAEMFANCRLDVPRVVFFSP